METWWLPHLIIIIIWKKYITIIQMFFSSISKIRVIKIPHLETNFASHSSSHRNRKKPDNNSISTVFTCQVLWIWAKKEEVIKWTEIYFQLIRSWKKDFSYKNFCSECCKMLWTKHPKPQMLLYYCVRQSKIKRKMSNAPWKTLSNPELSMHFDKKEWGYFENYILLVNVSSTHLSSLSV